MADEINKSREEWQSTYDAKAGELSTRVKSTTEYLKRIKELGDFKSRLLVAIDGFEQQIKTFEDQGRPNDDEELRVARMNRNLNYSKFSRVSGELDDITSKVWGNIQELPELIKDTYTAGISSKKAEAEEKRKKVTGELAEADKKEKEAEDATKSASPPSKWEKFKFYFRKIARIMGWVMLGLAVVAPLFVSAILGTITTVVGMAVSSLSGGASLALAIYGVYKYNSVKDAHKNDKSKSYKWANKDKAYKKKEKDVVTAEKNLQKAKVVQEQKRKEKETAEKALKDLDDVFKQSSREAYVVRGMIEIEKMFDRKDKIGHLKWKEFFSKCLIYLYINNKLSPATYNDMMRKAVLAKANEIDYGKTLSVVPDQPEFWSSDAPPYTDIPESCL